MPATELFEHVLVPTDGSDVADDAVEHAIAVLSTGGGTVHGLYVIDSRITMAAREDTRADLAADLEATGTAAVDLIADRASTEGLDTVTTIRRGTPWKEILEYAEEHDIDLIVMGNAGKSPREKLIRMGSVSERVVDNAAIPVLVVPAEAAEA